MNRHLAFATVSSVLLLGGCMVGPKYVKSTVPLHELNRQGNWR